VAHEDDEYLRALEYFAEAYAGYDASGDVRRQIRLLGDVGRSFRSLGMLAHARDAFVHVFLVQRGDLDAYWAAGINLIALAVDEDNVTLFDEYRALLERAPMPARLLFAYLVEVGDGHRHFGRQAAAEVAFERAARVAQRKKMTEQYDQAMGRLAGVVDERMSRAHLWNELPQTVRKLARTVRALGAAPKVLGIPERAEETQPQRRTQLKRGRPRTRASPARAATSRLIDATSPQHAHAWSPATL
jgi:tetratricopeptide (TPR) repeat protein